MGIEEAFERCTRVKRGPYGVRIDCSLGLWGVSALTEEEATREALRYFALYYWDGEYGALLEGVLNNDQKSNR